jgi:hypothetical protein
MFLITIENPKQQKPYVHLSGVLVLGRQLGGNETRIGRNDLELDAILRQLPRPPLVQKPT